MSKRICSLCLTRPVTPGDVTCDACWELDRRIRRDLPLARKLLSRYREPLTTGPAQSANAVKAQPTLDPGGEHQQQEDYLKLLAHAVKVIRTFRGIPLPDREEKYAWAIYYQNAAEMKPLREALEKAGVKL